MIKHYLSYDCLLIDELDYVEVEPVQVGLFFTLMHKRHRRKPTLITSNLGFRLESGRGRRWSHRSGNAPEQPGLQSRRRVALGPFPSAGPSRIGPAIPRPLPIRVGSTQEPFSSGVA